MADRSRRQVKEPSRFSPSAVRSGSSKRERSPPPSHPALDHDIIHADLTAIREEMSRQTRQLGRIVRAFADIQDILLDLHEEGAAQQERETKLAKSADPDVVSLQASAESIPIVAAAAAVPEPEVAAPAPAAVPEPEVAAPAPAPAVETAPKPPKSEVPFPTCVPPALLARMNSMAN